MKTFILAYVSCGLSFLGLDLAWLWVMGKAFYRPQLGVLVLEKFLPVPAVAFYLLYPTGIAVFALSPALQTGSALAALCNGLLFGLLAYATYDLTNMATLRGWSPLVTTVDMAWGAIATGTAAIVGFWVMKSLTSV